MKKFNYHNFLEEKSKIIVPTGIDGGFELHPELKPHQKDIISWALRRGRAAVFAGTGLGKTLIEMNWAEAVAKYTNKPVLMLAPLAVSAQIAKIEAPKFGYNVTQVKTGDEINGVGIYVTNYEKIDHFDLSVFGGIVLDESSILKSYNGAYRTKLISICQAIPFRLAATATPSPNDFMELGNHAEFLGIMSYTDMLATFFVHDGGSTHNWRLRGHAEDAFWIWMCSWAVMLRTPADLGYDASEYILPKLHNLQHTVGVEYVPDVETGLLFPMQAQTMGERMSARKTSVNERVEFAASISSYGPFVWWCNLNSESDALKKAIPGAVEIRGSDTEQSKEDKLMDFAYGNIEKLITKAKITGWGVNWQHCNNTGFVGLNDSFEQVYQAVRRFWRFGQKKEVYAHFIASEMEGAVVANLKRKEEQAERMAEKMVQHMADLSSLEIKGAIRDTDDYMPQEIIKLPAFMH